MSNKCKFNWTVSIALAPLTCVTLLLLVCLGQRAIFEWRFGELFDQTGYQTSSVYAVWRLRHGLELYMDPSEFGTITFYNFAFYRIYAFISQLLFVNDESLIVFLRYVTIFFGFCGVAILYRSIVSLARTASLSGKLFALFASICTWIAITPVGPWIIAVRPDILAACFSLSGLVLYLRSAQQPGALLSGTLPAALFFLAWATKQPSIGLFVGCIVHSVVMQRNFGTAMRLAIPFSIGVFVAFWILGDQYWMNTVAIPSTSRIVWNPLSVTNFQNLLLSNQVLWGYGVLAMLLNWPTVRSRNFGKHLPCILCCIAVTLPWNLLTTFREGGTDNGMLEAHLAFALLSVATAAEAIEKQRVWECVAIGVLGLLMLYMPLSVIRNTHPDFAAVEYGSRQEIRAQIEQMATPVFVGEATDMNETLTLPWISSANRFPACVPEVFTYSTAVREGVLPPDIIERLIRKQEFGSIVVARESKWAHVIGIAQMSGYVKNQEIHGTVILERKNEN
ncbi:MAG: hypothetical protein KDB27_22985 [Planctomycetales bacterium]|nr:hypothetical protein [Planctomycetales bacterium]